MTSASASEVYSSVQCCVDVYPWEGGQYSIQNGNVLECTVSTQLRPSGQGVAEITLAPGGPNGQSFPSWAQIVTINSLVVIAMARAQYSNVVFVGIVLSVTEIEDWENDQGVSRNTRIVCTDWGGWFNGINWNALTFLQCIPSEASQAVAGEPAASGPYNALFSGFTSCNPGLLAFNFFSGIMGGLTGVLASTTMQYQGAPLAWPAATFGFFEEYPYDAIFPNGAWYMSEEGTWFSKFDQICESPFYELIIGTAPSGTWTPAITPSTLNSLDTAALGQGDQVPLVNGGYAFSTPGTAFTSVGLPNAKPAYAQIVGRVNPLPDLNFSADQAAVSGLAGQSAYPYTGANLDRWNALKESFLDPIAGFMASETTLEMGEYYNFFSLSPTAFKVILGQASSNTPGVIPYCYAGCANLAGIHRYGIQCLQRETNWLVDTESASTQQAFTSTVPTVSLLVAGLGTRLASFYTPIPVMQNATLKTRLLPDLFVGTRFSYAPFRGDENWLFYINAVEHYYKFGGESWTQIGLERGLPESVYEDPQMMLAVLTGTAQRQDGKIVGSLNPGSAPGLQCFGFASQQLQQILSQIAQVFITPGAS